ncbi:FAD:protein FMN transferase [Actinokineospora sp. NBRC 105648]|uniref:FAD:protein FMN transferase n=1 Tax=Actinokineospora sp. NBRC 105648 TaxID=3032206 RepID=UPI0024A05816|nr:FAD:protein FMN transferase [Actinokineospora sp. NBRC 105648]GLZ36692.1 FAD:protein FMN transferase [Actinokineospora sp. NBRC 105648]
MTGRRAWVEQVMGMPVSLHLRGPGVREDPGLAAAAEGVFAVLRDVDRLFSTYRDDSEVSAIRRGEPSRHPLVRDVLGLCREARDRTDGLFDPWLLPGGFDPSGLVKGWAVERAAATLHALGDVDHCLNAGGDIALHVAAPSRPAWRVGIEDPRDRGAQLGVRTVRTGAVATSGTAARGAHIVDPRSGAPATGLLSVTVSGPSPLWADVYATAAFAHGPGAEAWLRRRAPEYEITVAV